VKGDPKQTYEQLSHEIKKGDAKSITSYMNFMFGDTIRRGGKVLLVAQKRGRGNQKKRGGGTQTLTPALKWKECQEKAAWGLRLSELG